MQVQEKLYRVDERESVTKENFFQLRHSDAIERFVMKEKRLRGVFLDPSQKVSEANRNPWRKIL